VLYGIAAVLLLAVRQGYGHVINVALIGTHRVTPAATVYAVTKHAIGRSQTGWGRRPTRCG
jgi:NADP-dependent 3-hydroxy acid dehydrogenase YdfG